MIQDEIVDTSDAEERETLEASNVLYWQQFALCSPRIQARSTTPSSTASSWCLNDIIEPELDEGELPFPLDNNNVPELSPSLGPRSPSVSLFRPLSSPPRTPPSSEYPVPSTSTATSPHEAQHGSFPSSPDLIASELSPLTPVDDNPGPSLHGEEQAFEFIDATRYSLRTRHAKQLNPYAYDKLLYKKQMQSNPDAIVKIVSPRRRAERAGRDNQDRDMAEEEWMIQSDEDEGLEHRRKGNRRARLMSPAAQNSQEVQTWYPKELGGQMSSDSGDENEFAKLIGEARMIVEPSGDKTRNNRANKRTMPFPRLKRLSSKGPSALHDRNSRQLFPGTDDLRSPNDSLDHQGDTLSPRIPLPSGSGFAHSDIMASNVIDDPSVDTTSDFSESPPNSPQPEVRGLKDLKKVWPAVMVNQYLENYREPTSVRQRTTLIRHDSSEEDRPLQPGETRVRSSTHLRNTHDIRGDSESSLESANDSSDEPVALLSPGQCDTANANPRFLHQKPQTHGNASGSSDLSDNSHDGSDCDVDDAEINTWLADESSYNRCERNGPVPREDLIDWMLCRTRNVGGTANGEKRSRRTKKRSKLDIVTRGARRYGSGRQTLLPFHSSNSKQSTAGHSKTNAPRVASPTGKKSAKANADIGEESAVHSVQQVSERKRKRRRPDGRGSLHVFLSKGTHVSSGRRRRRGVTLTVDLEDEGFHKALAPVCVDGPKPHVQLTPPPRSIPRTSGIAPRRSDEFSMADVEGGIGEHERSRKVGRRSDIPLDFDISFLPSGITFAPDTYLGKGRLHELVTAISDDSEVISPVAYSAHGLHLFPTMSLADFLNSFDVVCNGLLDLAKSPAHSKVNHVKEWQDVTHVVCQLVSWLPGSLHSQDCHLLQTVIGERLLRLIADTEELEDLIEDVECMTRWFVVEVSARLANALRRKAESPLSVVDILVKSIMRTTQRLLLHSAQRAMVPIQPLVEDLNPISVSRQTVELWICLHHLLEHCDIGTPRDHVHPLWKIVQQTSQSDGHLSRPGLEASEAVWRMIFSLCALSQFSVHGMSTSSCRIGPSWELVVFALRKIRLTAESDDNHALSERSLDKRDHYVRLVTSRCFLLAARWHWKLDHAAGMFNELAEIFRSRSFANLRLEPSDFPAFMRHHDVGLLSQYKPNDTAFELFLKLIVRAAHHGVDNNGQNLGQNISSKSKKLLSLAIPVGSVSFTKANPPTIHEISMLYNRFGAIAVTIYLDSTTANVQFRLAHARRYANFNDADENTRIACIRGAMYFAILMCRRHIPLDHVLCWIADMTEVLANECSNTNLATKKSGNSPPNVVRDRALFCLQLLLGSVRQILEACQTYPPQPEYPNLALLNGPWITRLISSANFMDLMKTRVEIWRVLKVFLDARAAVIPELKCSQQHSVAGQESQDEYGPLELDWDDPNLLALFGDADQATRVKEISACDSLVSKVIEDHICPAIYHHICKSPSPSTSFDDYCHDAYQWIDCWVRCAAVVVQNKKQDWSQFLQLGPQSWEKIIEPSWRRWVGLRFMFKLLQYDSRAYLQHKTDFMQVFLESIVTAKVTMEHEYMTLLFNIDGLQHPLLLGVADFNIHKLDISMSDFLDFRLPILKAVFANLAESLQKESKGETGLTAENQTSVRFLIHMLSRLEDAHKNLTGGADAHATYLDFCRGVCKGMLEYPELVSQPRLANWVEWARVLLASA